MPLMKASALAAYNKQPYQSRNYRISVDPPAGFSPGDYVPLVIYNAFVGSHGKGMRSLAQKTSARLFHDHVVVDEFDPAMDLSLTPDGYPLFELVGYLVDANNQEHLLFTLKIQKNEVKPKRLYPSDQFPIGSRPLVRIYLGRTRDTLGQKVGEVTGEISDKGLKLPATTLQSCVNPITGEVLHVKELTFWLVAPDGKEHFAYSGKLKPNQSPPFPVPFSDPDSVH